MVTVPVLLPDHHGRDLSPWTSGFPSRRRREEQELVRQLPCPLWSLPAPGFRVGAKDKARLSVSLASHLSPKDVPNLSGPLLQSLPPPGCLTSHIQIHLVVGTVGVDGAQCVLPNLVSISSGSTKVEH